MRSRVPLFVLLFVIGFFVLSPAVHAAIPFFGPIVPDSINRCAAGWGAVIDIVNRIIEFLITLAIVFVAPLTIAYAGFLYVVNPVDPSGISKAKGILWNTVIGIVIALSGWLIVDALMAVLYNAVTPVGTTGGVLGTWSNIISSGGKPFCLIQEASLKDLNQATPGVGVTGIGGNGVITTTSGFSYNPGIDAQIPTESSALNTLLSCMGPQLKSTNTGAIITSISDSVITNGTRTIQQCATQGKTIGCAHTANSCHYGGRNCVDKGSYAVDLAGNLSAIDTVAKACGASTLNEGNHLHVSVGGQNSCGCDASLD